MLAFLLVFFALLLFYVALSGRAPQFWNALLQGKAPGQ